MVSSAQEILPESTGVVVQTSSADVRDKDFLSHGNVTRSIDSEVAGIGVERLPRIGGAWMVEPQDRQTDSQVVVGKSKWVRAIYPER